MPKLDAGQQRASGAGAEAGAYTPKPCGRAGSSRNPCHTLASVTRLALGAVAGATWPSPAGMEPVVNAPKQRRVEGCHVRDTESQIHAAKCLLSATSWKGFRLRM